MYMYDSFLLTLPLSTLKCKYILNESLLFSLLAPAAIILIYYTNAAYVHHFMTVILIKIKQESTKLNDRTFEDTLKCI